MKLFKFELNTIVFLGIVVTTILMWIGFEFYHQQSKSSIDSELKQQSETQIENSFDTGNLNEIYNTRVKFYENTSSSSN